MRTILTVTIWVFALAAAAAELPIREWRLLGPQLEPAVAILEPGTEWTSEQALALDRFDPTLLRAVDWPTKTTPATGALTLAASGPAVAWMFTTVHVERFVTCELQLLGTGPRRAWLDGVAIASGTSDEVGGALKLAPGTHRLLLQVLREPAATKPWVVGARLSKKNGELGGIRVGGASDILDLQDTLEPPTISDVALSHDGQLYALKITRTIPGTTSSESWIEIRDVARGQLQAALRGVAGLGQFAFDPSSRRAAYLTTAQVDGKSKGTIWLWTPDELAPLISSIEGLSSFVWSPTGRELIYTVSQPSPAPAQGVRRAAGLLDRQPPLRDRVGLFRIVLQTGQRDPISAPSRASLIDGVSSDGKRLLISRFVDDISARPYLARITHEIEVETGQSRELVTTRFARQLGYEPGGARLLVVTGSSEFGGTCQTSDAGEIPNDYDGELVLYDPRTQSATCLTQSFLPGVDAARWNPFDRKIYVVARDRDYSRLFRLDPQTGVCEPLAVNAEAVQWWALAERAPLLMVYGDGSWNFGSLEMVALDTLQRSTIPTPPSPALQRIARGKVDSWSFTSSRDAEIDARVYLPPDFDPSRRYPLIVNYYGGTFSIEREFGGRYPKEWWASLGYVVLVLQPSGAVGYGPTFSAKHVREWGSLVPDEIIEGTQRYLESHRFVDPARVGVIGASYGGFTTMALLTKTKLFTAAVSHAGISSIGGYWGQGLWGYSYNAVSAAERFPWNDRQTYVEQSPLFHADKIETPLLLTHGVSDTNVPVGESVALYTALKLLNRPVELLTVDGEDHWILTHPKRLLWARSIVAWFDKWLKAEPEWWDDLHPPEKRTARP